MDSTYKNWIQDLKQKIKAAQLKAALAVNAEMILLYWEIGKEIVEKQNNFSWGSKVIEMMAKDLKRELPDTNGFSRSNLFSMRKFYLFYNDSELVQHLGGQTASGDDKLEKGIVQQAAGQLKKRHSKPKNELVQQPVGQLKSISSKHDANIVHQAGGQLDKKVLLTQIPWRHHVTILHKCATIKEAKFYIEQIGRAHV